MVDAADSKSACGDTVEVRVLSPVPFAKPRLARVFCCAKNIHGNSELALRQARGTRQVVDSVRGEPVEPWTESTCSDHPYRSSTIYWAGCCAVALALSRHEAGAAFFLPPLAGGRCRRRMTAQAVCQLARSDKALHQPRDQVRARLCRGASPRGAGSECGGIPRGRCSWLRENWRAPVALQLACHTEPHACTAHVAIHTLPIS